MSKAWGLAKLDFLTIMPYKMNLISMAVLMAMMCIPTVSDSALSLGITVAYATIISFYPFSIGEKSRLETFQGALPVSRRNVIIGRYIFSFLIQIIFPVVRILESFIFSIASSGVIEVDAGIFAASAASLFISSVLVALQMPIYFKLGYNKSKGLSYLPIIIIVLLSAGAETFLGEFNLLHWLPAYLNSLSLPVIISGTAFMYIGIMTTSYNLSVKFYESRDL